MIPKTRQLRLHFLREKLLMSATRKPAVCFSTRAAASSSFVHDLYSEDHLAMAKSLRTFIDREINPHVSQWEKEETWPAKEIALKMGQAGFLGLTKPVEYGGQGLDYSYSVMMSEEMGTVNCGGFPMAIGVITDMSTPALAKHGSDYVKKTFLQPTILGEIVPCLGVSEPGAGSDVAGIKTTAVKDGGDYIINGSKMWITNGMQADWICLLANTSEGPAHANKSLICVPMNSPGISTSKIHKLGMRCSDTAQVFFDNVRVPQVHVIGEEGKGFIYQMEQFQEERLFCAASALKCLDICIQDTIEYTRSRKAFNATLLDNQYIQYRIGEMQTEVECLRALVYRATNRYINGEDVTLLASMSKLKAGRVCREVTDGCLQFWGGMGYSEDSLISRAMRDMRLNSIGGGADEVMLSIIAKLMGMSARVKNK